MTRRKLQPNLPLTGIWTNNPLRIVSISDIHLGHRKVDSYTICNHLRQFLFPKIEESNLLIFGGDVFEMLLTLTDHTNIIITTLIELLALANKHNVYVRILRGTFSHDRTQNKIFETLHTSYGFANSLRYFSTMSCEYIEELNVRLAYIPDDLPYESSDAAMEFFRSLLDQNGWDTVDYVIAHGYFEHRIPANAPHCPKCTFRIDQFKPFVKRYVLVGHIHISDMTDIVLYNGSFERLAHGEEDPKGFITIVDDGAVAKIEFVENTEAYPFKTIDMCHIDTIDEVVEYFLDEISIYTAYRDVHVRGVHPSVEVKNILSKLVSRDYPNIHYTHKIAQKDLDDRAISLTTLELCDYPAPTEENLPSMVFDFCRPQYPTLSSDRIKEILEQKKVVFDDA